MIDIGLPDADGRDLCQALRARGIQTPVLFLTARDALVDRIAGFDAGGDDYLAKPFALVELVARLQALLRRSGGARRARGRGASARPGHARGRAGGDGGAADADRVPAAGAAACASGRGGSPSRRSSARAGRTARSCARTRSTRTSPACAQAARARRRARRSSPFTASATARMNRLGIRRRLAARRLGDRRGGAGGAARRVQPHPRTDARPRTRATRASLPRGCAARSRRRDAWARSDARRARRRRPEASAWVFAQGRVLERRAYGRRSMPRRPAGRQLAREVSSTSRPYYVRLYVDAVVRG